MVNGPEGSQTQPNLIGELHALHRDCGIIRCRKWQADANGDNEEATYMNAYRIHG